MSENPLVSVIIPTYNGHRYIEETVKSALAQTLQPIEVLVIDDGSTDNTAEILAKYPVRHIWQPNGGTAKARNRGIQESSGKFIALLDHDDLWEPTNLEHQIPLFEGENVGIVHTGTAYFLSESLRVTSEVFAGSESDYHSILGMSTLPPSSMVLSRRALDCVGIFNEAISNVDDWDLSLRVASSFRIVGTPHILTRLRVHDQNQGKNFLKMYANAIKVLDLVKARSVHGVCLECGQAVRKSKKVWGESVYVGYALAARRNWAAGRYLTAIVERLRAYIVYPRGLLHVFDRALRRYRGYVHGESDKAPKQPGSTSC